MHHGTGFPIEEMRWVGSMRCGSFSDVQLVTSDWWWWLLLLLLLLLLLPRASFVPTWANYTLLHVKHANLCQNILNLIIQKKSRKTTFPKKTLGNMMLPFLRSDVEKVYRMTPWSLYFVSKEDAGRYYYYFMGNHFNFLPFIITITVLWLRLWWWYWSYSLDLTHILKTICELLLQGDVRPCGLRTLGIHRRRWGSRNGHCGARLQKVSKLRQINMTNLQTITGPNRSK